MKIHISLDNDLLPDKQSRLEVLKVLEKAFVLRNVNRKRAERYGIISAEVDPQDIERISAFGKVKSCEADKEQRAIKKVITPITPLVALQWENNGR